MYKLIRNKILKLTKEFYKKKFENKKWEKEDRIPFAGRVFDEREMLNLVDASLDFWLTAGRYAQDFEYEFAEFWGTEYCMLVNSGSSANLLALTALTSPKLGKNRLKPGDEVITVAAGFPTTINPIIQNGLIPVFVDVDLETYNINTENLENAITPKTKAIMIAHTMGNPFNLSKIMEVVEKNNLFLVEDCCDAVGSKYNGKLVGNFGHLSTVSFYPAHHMTMGEGGAVLTNDEELMKIVTSFRDWGRDCYCAPGADNTCGRRFSMKHGNLPYGYDHKYVYSHIGYNLKITDMQAAVGMAQLEKLPQFIQKRKQNWKELRKRLEKFNQYLILPQATDNSDPSWFGFVISVRENSSFTRNELTSYLEENKIMTRLLFAGNATKQPAYDHVKFKISGSLKNTDFIMNNTFFIGVYPGIDEEQIEYMANVFSKFFKKVK
jgi:CDP-6-deoxy-D-xylo-4-hexulose-3-dehydrase